MGMQVIRGGVQPRTDKGQPNGYAALDSSGHVPVGQLASGTPDANFVLTGAGWLPVTGAAPPPPALTAFTATQPGTGNAGSVVSVTVTAKGAGGATLTGYLGTVIFTSTDGAAVLPLSYTFVAGDAGVKVFAVKYNTAGAQTVTVSDIAAAITQTTAACTITVSSAWDPTTIANLALWARAELQTETNGTAVATVVNQTGGTAGTSPSSGKRPLRITGVAGTNLRATLRYDGVDDTTVFAPVDLHNGFTWVSAMRLRSLVAQAKIRVIWDEGSAVDCQLQMFVDPNGALTVFVIHVVATFDWIGRVTNPTVVVAGEDADFMVTYDGTNTAAGIAIYKNGVRVDATNALQNTFTVLTGASARGWQVGAQGTTSSSPAPLDLHEELLWTRALNSTERDTVTTQLAAYYGLTQTTITNTPSGSSITRQETVSVQPGVTDSNGASGWGVDKSRLLRATDGSLYHVDVQQPTIPMGPGDEADYRRFIEMWKRTGTNTWVNQAISFESGQQNGYVVQDGSAKIWVQGWPGGYQHNNTITPHRLRLWDSASGTTRDLGLGAWMDAATGGAEWPYASVGVDVALDRLVVQRNVLSPASFGYGNPGVNIPGYFNTMVRSSAGAWTGPFTWQTAERYAYFFWTPNGTGWDAYATRDLAYIDIGINQGGFVFDAVKRFSWTGLPTGNPTSELVIRAEFVTNTPNDLLNFCQIKDLYIDNAGNHHLLIYAHGPGSNYQYNTYHYVFSAAHAFLGMVQIPLPASDKMRMTQDSTGRYWFFTINQAVLNLCSSTDADLAGAGHGLAVTAPNQIALSATWTSDYLTYNIFTHNRRNGGDQALQDYVDILVTMYTPAHAGISVYLRLQLR